jgi:hypothetical protein
MAGVGLVSFLLVANGCSGCVACGGLRGVKEWVYWQEFYAQRRLRAAGKPECDKDSVCSRIMTCPSKEAPVCEEPEKGSKGYCDCAPLRPRQGLSDAGATCTEKSMMVFDEDASLPMRRACLLVFDRWYCGRRDPITLDILDGDGGLVLNSRLGTDGRTNWCKNATRCGKDSDCQRFMSCPSQWVAACDLLPENHERFCDCAPLQRLAARSDAGEVMCTDTGTMKLDVDASAPMHVGCRWRDGEICGRVDNNTGDLYDEDGGLLVSADGGDAGVNWCKDGGMP